MNYKRIVYNRYTKKFIDGLREKKKINYKKKFIKSISKYNVISFDVFDTLITRLIYNPDDLFILIGKNINLKTNISFIEMRKQAEKQAINKLKKDVNIDEIYDEFLELYNLDKKLVNKIKDTEIEYELKLIYPREDMITILENLMNKGKKVILTSDMYLTKDIIVKMLKKCGYKEGVHYSEIYVSNDLNKRKDNGTIWPYLKELYRKKIVHIGDNNNSDFLLPKKYGLKAVHISSPREQLYNTVFYEKIKSDIDNRTIEDSLLLGYFINGCIFNSPFMNEIRSVKTVSNVLISPLLYDFLKFISEKTNKNSRLLFLSREGYNLVKLYNDFCDINNYTKKESIYFLTSRKAAISATLDNDKDILNYINKDYKGSLSKFMKSNFDIDYFGEDMNIILPNDLDTVKEIVFRYRDTIIKKSKDYKNNYLKYIDKTLKKNLNNIILIDLGYSGSIQYYLSKMLDRDLKGIYLTNTSSVKKHSDKSELLFAFDINDNKEYENIYHYSLLLEYFLSAPYGQLQYFSEEKGKVKPIYNDEYLDEKKKENIEIIYEGAIEYIKTIKLFNEIIDFSANKEIIYKFFKESIDTNLISKTTKNEFSFVDSFTKSDSENIFKIFNRY